MRFAVIGAGSIGQRHCRNLLALGQQVVAWDPDRERRREIAAIAGASAAESLRHALDAACDAALICAPPAEHVALARQALDAGLHLFVEKPIARSSREVPPLIEEATRRGKLIAVGMNLRFLPSLGRVAALLDAKRVGRVLSVQAEFGAYLPDWRPGRDYRDNYAVSAAAGGGILLDAIHEPDYLGWLFGEATEVCAVAEHVSDLAGDTEDLALLTVRYASGLLAHVHLDYLQRAYRRELRVIGDAGVLVWDYPRHTVTVHDADGEPHAEDFRSVEGDGNLMYVEAMRQFIACVEGRERPAVEARQALAALRLVEAAKRSSRERRWVTL